jgi:hypothetical protein
MSEVSITSTTSRIRYAISLLTVKDLRALCRASGDPKWHGLKKVGLVDRRARRVALMKMRRSRRLLTRLFDRCPITLERFYACPSQPIFVHAGVPFLSCALHAYFMFSEDFTNPITRAELERRDIVDLDASVRRHTDPSDQTCTTRGGRTLLDLYSERSHGNEKRRADHDLIQFLENECFACMFHIICSARTAFFASVRNLDARCCVDMYDNVLRLSRVDPMRAELCVKSMIDMIDGDWRDPNVYASPILKNYIYRVMAHYLVEIEKQCAWARDDERGRKPRFSPFRSYYVTAVYAEPGSHIRFSNREYDS